MLGAVMMKMIIKCYVDVDHSCRPVTSRLLYLSASRGVYYSQSGLGAPSPAKRVGETVIEVCRGCFNEIIILRILLLKLAQGSRG